MQIPFFGPIFHWIWEFQVVVSTILLSHLWIWTSNSFSQAGYVKLFHKIQCFFNYLLFLGTVLKFLPRIFLGYLNLLISTSHVDSFVLRIEKFKNINEQLKHGCVLVQAYGIFNETPLKYIPFPTDIGNCCIILFSNSTNNTI